MLVVFFGQPLFTSPTLTHINDIAFGTSGHATMDSTSEPPVEETPEEPTVVEDGALAAAEPEPPAEASADGEAEPTAEEATEEGAESVEKLIAAASDKASEIEASGTLPLPTGPPPLPAGWVEATDPRYNNATYWFHEVTKQTSWVRPSARTGVPPPPPQGPPLPSAPPPISGDLISTLAGETHYGDKDPEIETKLDEWVVAKRAKDFGTSDRLREELRGMGSRGMGVDPDLERPVKQRRVTLGEGVDVSLDEEQQLMVAQVRPAGRWGGVRGWLGGGVAYVIRWRPAEGRGLGSNPDLPPDTTPHRSS